METLMLSNQHGVIEKSDSLSTEFSFARKFFDSFDKNLLANHKIGLIMAILEATLRPILLVGLGLLVFTGTFTVDTAVAFFGSLAYLLSSIRTTFSYGTNLLRFQPQVNLYHNFIDSLYKIK